MEMKNGVNLIRTSKPKDGLIWTVVQYTGGKIVAVYHTPYIHLKPMNIVLSEDEQSYWIDSAVVYSYHEMVIYIENHKEVKSMVLFIGKSDKVTIDTESLKNCFQDDLTTKAKTTRKRTKVQHINKQTTVSPSV